MNFLNLAQNVKDHSSTFNQAFEQIIISRDKENNQVPHDSNCNEKRTADTLKVTCCLKVILSIVTLAFTLSAVSLAFMILTISENPTDIQVIRIQDQYQWQNSLLFILPIILTIFAILKLLLLLKPIIPTLPLLLQVQSSIISCVLILVIISWLMSSDQSYNIDTFCTDSRFKRLDDMYNAFSQEAQENCCPKYPNIAPYWSSFYKCNRNGADEDCLASIPSYELGKNIVYLEQFNEMEINHQCAGICTKPVVPLNPLKIQPSNNKLKMCMRVAIDLYKQEMKQISIYAYILIVIEAVQYFIYMLFLQKIQSLSFSQNKQTHL